MSNQLSKFLAFYKEHFFSWQFNIVGVKSVFKYEEIKWRQNWFMMVGNLLDAHYRRAGKLEFSKKTEWHSNQHLDVFPGYYYLQCMLQMIARKQEVARLRRSEEGVFEVDNSLVGVQGNFIGKEISLNDSQDPLGAKKALNN